MSDTVKIFRIECPETGMGMYKFISPVGRRNDHPSSQCPTPSLDRPLVDFLCATYSKYYNKSGYKSQSYGSFYDYGVKLINTGPEGCPWNYYSNIDYTGNDSNSPWYFGFANMDQLIAWMDDHSIQRAIDYNLVLSIYEVHETAAGIGDTQAVFFRSCARIVERRSLKTLLTKPVEPAKKVVSEPSKELDYERFKEICNSISRLTEESLSIRWDNPGLFGNSRPDPYENSLRYEFNASPSDLRRIGKFKFVPVRFVEDSARHCSGRLVENG